MLGNSWVSVLMDNCAEGLISEVQETIRQYLYYTLPWSGFLLDKSRIFTKGLSSQRASSKVS
jgi:hypothetical protein